MYTSIKICGHNLHNNHLANLLFFPSICSVSHPFFRAKRSVFEFLVMRQVVFFLKSTSIQISNGSSNGCANLDHVDSFSSFLCTFSRAYSLCIREFSVSWQGLK